MDDVDLSVFIEHFDDFMQSEIHATNLNPVRLMSAIFVATGKVLKANVSMFEFSELLRDITNDE